MRHVGRRTTRVFFITLALVYMATHFLGHAHAQSSLGIGAGEASLPSTGLFAGLLNWINLQQQGFYRSLTGALREMRETSGGAWLLVGLSFAYGVFHAAGPGHGKAVISSYMLANEVALRRGIVLSFVSAMLQATTAIVVMGTVYFFLRGTALSMTDATRFLEITSYALIAGFGLWLLWKKAGPRLARLMRGHPVHALSAGVAGERIREHGHNHGPDHHHHGHAHDEVCASCGHAHAPDPQRLAAPQFDWKSAWAAVAAVGLRPCSGALIVLSFSLLNGLWIAGVLSVFAMAIGTAITVSILATLAVTAKNWAVLFAGNGRWGNAVHAGIEIAGAAFVFLIGAMLLAASINAA